MPSRGAVSLAVCLVLIPATAHAYVDPGLVSMFIQGVFAAVAGFVAIYVVGPWRWLKGLFTRHRASGEDRPGTAARGGGRPAS